MDDCMDLYVDLLHEEIEALTEENDRLREGLALILVTAMAAACEVDGPPTNC